MQVKIGNSKPKVATSDGAPVITYLNIPDTYTVTDGADTSAIMKHLWQHPDITHLPDHEALVLIAQSNGAWKAHSDEMPTWVWSDNKILESQLQSLFEVGGIPEDVEDTHWTLAGAPGVVPAAALMKDIQANITQNGRDIFSRNMFSGSTAVAGNGTGASATQITGTSGLVGTTNYNGYKCWAYDRTAHVFAWGNVTANASTTITVDQWYNPATYAVQALTNGTTDYVLSDQSAAALWMALSTSSSSPASPATDTSLPSEIIVGTPSGEAGGGGLLRKIVGYSHSASANTVVLTATYTINSNDNILPVTIYKMGVFNSALSTDTTSTMLFETLLTTSATLSVVGDQITISETVTTT